MAIISKALTLWLHPMGNSFREAIKRLKMSETILAVHHRAPPPPLQKKKAWTFTSRGARAKGSVLTLGSEDEKTAPGRGRVGKKNTQIQT